VTSTDFNLHTVGVILMIVGAVGFVVSLLFWASWGGFGGWHRSSRTVYQHDDGTVVEDRHHQTY
jgi:hypothetical protein